MNLKNIKSLLGVLNVLLAVEGTVHEQTLKIVSRPLDGVFDQVGEVFQSAQRDRLLRRVLGLSVGLCELGVHNLRITLGPQCAALQQGPLVEHAPAVNVNSCLGLGSYFYIVDGVHGQIQTFPKLVVEKLFVLGTHQQLNALVIESGVHLLCRLASGLGFIEAHVLFSEQKLSIQIRSL